MKHKLNHKIDVKKEYVQVMRYTLESYHILEETKVRLESDLTNLRSEVSIQGIAYDRTRVQSSGINKSTERNAIWNMEDEKELKLQILECDQKTKLLKDTIDLLDGDLSSVVRLRYIEKLSWFEVEDKLFIGTRGGKYRLERALVELAYLFYGNKALVSNKIDS